MPIYEYRCADCQKESTVFFPSFSAVTPPACPHCGSGNVRRLISLVAAVRSGGEGADTDFGEGDEGGHGHEDSEGFDSDGGPFGSEEGSDFGGEEPNDLGDDEY